MKLNRRHVLRAGGVSLALPWLEAHGAVSAKPRRRMVCICAQLSLHPPNLFPQKPGKDYALTPYLEVLKDLRQDFTIASGLMQVGMTSGFAHAQCATFLTGVPGAGRPGFRNAISLDQLAAKYIGDQTRMPTLSFAGEGAGLSWTRTGAPVPATTTPSKVFAKLFLEDTPEEHRAQLRRLQDGRSILDKLHEQANKLETRVGRDDREKLDEYMTSTRELEQRLAKDQERFEEAKPKVDAKFPNDIANSADLVGRTTLMYDLTHLALQTDSTRLITIMLGGSSNKPVIDGVTSGHHDLPHHGQDPGKLAQLKIVELEVMRTFRDLLVKLKRTKEDEATLLDRTMVFLGSNLGDGNSHSVTNLPVILAGGGFKHGRYMAFEQKNPTPLCNLYVSMLQRLGIPEEKFGSSTGTLAGLEAVG